MPASCKAACGRCIGRIYLARNRRPVTIRSAESIRGDHEAISIII